MIAHQENRFKRLKPVTEQELNHVAGLQSPVNIISQKDNCDLRAVGQAGSILFNFYDQTLQQVAAAMNITDGINAFAFRRRRYPCNFCRCSGLCLRRDIK